MLPCLPLPRCVFVLMWRCSGRYCSQAHEEKHLRAIAAEEGLGELAFCAATVLPFDIGVVRVC
jgi:hypothetical protein